MTRAHLPAGTSLLGPWSALGLLAAAGVAFAAVFPLSREREGLAFESAPDMLALSYLELALTRAPSDAGLRLRVAERTLGAGRFDRTRALLAPLLAEHPTPAEATRLAIEVDYRAWAATDPRDARLRGVARQRLTQTLARSEYWRLPDAQLEHVAWVCAQLGLGERRAQLLERVARADLGHDARLAAASSAWLEVGGALQASALRRDRALSMPDRDGPANAALALEHALGSGEPGAALLTFRQLRPWYGRDARVLELGLRALAGVDDVQALGVARELLALRPQDASLRQRISELEAWTRPPAAAPVLAAAAPPALRWDTESTASVPLAVPNGPRALERAALLDSVGQPERALELIERALASTGVDEHALWDLRAGVQLRLGREREALATLERMDERFGPTHQSVLRRAELLLSLGELPRALELLESAPGPRTPEDERRITAIGWELGDMPRVRAAYRRIARDPSALLEDVRRLWLLERDAGDASAGARAALAGYERFADAALLGLALHAALEAGDDALVSRVLEHTAGAAPPGLDPGSSRWIASVRQQRAQRALLAAQPAQAKLELEASGRLLAKAAPAQSTPLPAAASTPDPDPALDLWRTQDRQLLELALAQDDRALLARVYPQQAAALTPRERVHVLHRLGRDEDAVQEAVGSLEQGGVPEHDAGALRADAEALGASMPRQWAVLGDVQSLPGLTAARAGASVRGSWSGGRTLGAQLELTRLGAWSAGSLSGLDELAAELDAGLGRSRLALGVVALDGRDPRPSLRFEQGLFGRDPDADAAGGGAEDVQLELLARLNERSHDTPELRVIGVEDEVAARASIDFLGSYSASARGSAKLYSDRDRHYLGAGATLDAAVGRNFDLPGDLGAANLRVAGYLAPRFEQDLAGPVPEGASWVGVGATLTRGQLSVAPVAGRRISLLADVTAGWLMPLDQLGWSTRFGLGISLLGADQLSILASASNVVSTLPGFAVYTLGADYAISRW